MSRSKGISRRTLFRMTGGGVIVLIGLGAAPVNAQDGRRLYPEDFNAWLVIREDGRVSVFSGKIEMGQGVWTSQAQMVAEELDVELAAIDMVLGDTDQCPWDMGTFGSLTTRMLGPALRAAAASARQTLKTLAADKFNVPVEAVATRLGSVYVIAEPDRRLQYGALSRGARIVQLVGDKAILNDAADFRVMGKSPVRLDAQAKVTGAAKYAADIRLPGLMYARILRPPMHGASLLSLDTTGAEKLAGVVLVRNDNLTAVLHPDPEAAAAALMQIRADWSLPAQRLDPDSIFEHILRQANRPKDIGSQGDMAAARANAVRMFEVTYQKGYVAHAPLEPHAAVADVRDGKATIWASTQTPFPARDQIAQALGFEPGNVRVITPFLGGGFGGKSANGQAVEAAQLAQLSGRPVQVAWSRAEEFFYDRFDPASVVTLASGIDRDGNIALWDAAVYAAGERGAVPPYDIANQRVRSYGGISYASDGAGASLHPFAVGPWRAPGANMNVFAGESQIDTMARAAGMDPLAFRLKHLKDPRMIGVLHAAAQTFGWTVSKAPGARGFGLACSLDAGTYVATMAEVVVNPRTGQVRVLRVVCAQDMGIVVNPEGAKMQIEGGITMGLGYTFSEELQFHGGEVLDLNFDQYSIPTFSAAPPVTCVLVHNDGLAPQGGGEPAITTTAAVMANAIFDAIGVRMTRLPMTPARVLQAIQAKQAELPRSATAGG